jgi:ribosome-associated protein
MLAFKVMMVRRKLAEYCANLGLDKKAENVLILDLSQRASVAEYFVIMSGMSDRQVRALAEHVSDSMREQGIKPNAEEGFADGRWALIDFGDVIVHIFQDHLRDYYSLETLLGDAPRIRLKPADMTYSHSQASSHA